MRAWMPVFLLVSSSVFAESLGHLEGQSKDGTRFHLSLESINSTVLSYDSNYSRLHTFTDQPCVFLMGDNSMLACTGLPGTFLNGTLYRQAGEPDANSQAVQLECEQGCSDQVPLTMRYMPDQC